MKMETKRAIRQMRALEGFDVRNGMRLAAEGWDAEWKTLIATIMSAQSRDETTIVIASNLFDKYNGVEKLAHAEYSNVLHVFSGLNYNKTKAINIINCAKELIDKYNGKVPHDFDKLVELPGVGRKTANVFLSEFGHDGLGVDTHVFYISRKLKWSNGKTPEKVEEDLKKLFPQKMWSRINPALVRFGKTHTSRKEKDKLLEEIKKIS